MGILGQREADDPDEPDSSSRLASLRDRVGRLLAAVVERSRRSAAALHATTDRLTGPPVGHRSLPGHTTAGPELATCPSMEGFPEREYLLTYPGRELSAINSPDVVRVETDHGLRLSVPENPEATLTSDVWMPVEP